MRSQIPEPWATALLRAGITDPRNKTRPSLNQLAKTLGRHTTTVTNMVHGNRRTDPRLVEATAEVLGVPREEVAGWVGRAHLRERPYEPPAVAALLTEEQRLLVDALIRQLATPALKQAPTDTADTTADTSDEAQGAGEREDPAVPPAGETLVRT